MAIRGSYEAALRKGVTTALRGLHVVSTGSAWLLRVLRSPLFAKIALRGSYGTDLRGEGVTVVQRFYNEELNGALFHAVYSHDVCLIPKNRSDSDAMAS